MKEKQPQLILTCFPFKEGDHLTKGKAVNCSRCNAAVWASDSSFKRMKDSFPQMNFEEKPPLILCLKCTERLATLAALAGQEMEIRPPSGEQLDEVRIANNKNNPNVN